MMNTLRLSLLIVTSSLFFSACTSSDIPLAPKSPSFKLGETDGCATASGSYTKDSENFRNNVEYANGWFAGRKNCNPVNAVK